MGAKSMGRSFWGRLFKGITVLVGLVVLVEVFCFMVITLSIYFIYGQFREGEPVRYDANALYINRHGVRPTAYNASPEAGDLTTIWMFGGSTTRGISLDDRETLPSFLARQLNQTPPVMTARVVNFGVDGFNALMESKYLQKMLIDSPAPPQIVVFYDGANDCAYFGQYRTPYAHHGYRQVRGVVESYHQSLFGMFKSLNAAWHTSFAWELYDKMRQGVFAISPEDPALQEYLDLAERRYDYIDKVARCFGADFQLFWQPCWWVETAPVAPAVKEQEEKTIILSDRWALQKNFVLVYSALFERLRDKPYFVDFRHILCSRTEPVYESDGIHLNPAGDRMVAAHMGEFLKNKFGASRDPRGRQ
jgi:lysophospholipase L1-like esterase